MEFGQEAGHHDLLAVRREFCTNTMNDERLLSVAEARAIDLDAATRLQMPTLLLMENAARAVADEARRLARQFVILAGAGNNGGDALAAARHLGREHCRIHLLAEPLADKSPDAALQLRILRAAGWPIELGCLLAAQQGPATCWIDGLFGTGLDRELSGTARAWVEACNQSNGPVLAIDIPSGLHGDTGSVLGAAVRATTTVTFVAKKRGMALGAGPAHCGRIVVAGLGLP